MNIGPIVGVVMVLVGIAVATSFDFGEGPSGCLITLAGRLCGVALLIAGVVTLARPVAILLGGAA